MNKDPVFEMITFYWLSLSVTMFGIISIFIVLSLILVILKMPYNIWYKIKRMYDERKV